MTTRSDGFLRWVMPAMIAMVALTALLSGRDLSQAFLELAHDTEPVRGPITAWAQRLVSLLLVAAAVERMVTHFAQRRHLPSPALALIFVLYWIGTVALPAFFGAHPQLSHEYLYTLVLGLASVLVTSSERDGVLDAARGALFLFIAAGLVLIPVMPPLVMDLSYNQGLIAGLPRFGGLAPHAVAMGMFAQIALLLLWARPFRRRWLTVLAWIIGGAALFLAQSKTAWIGFVLCAICMFAVRDPGACGGASATRATACSGVFVCVLAGTLRSPRSAGAAVGDLEAQVADFADTAQGAQLILDDGARPDLGGRHG